MLTMPTELPLHRAKSAAVLRVSFGAIMLLFYLLHFSHSSFYWGPTGQVPYALYIHASSGPKGLFQFSSSPIFAQAIFIISFFVTACFTFGLFTGASSIAFAICTFSMFERNRFMQDGGEHLLLTLSVYLCFTQNAEYLTLRPRKTRSRDFTRAIRTIVHNASMLVISCQIALVYFWASFYKIEGITWRNGTALFYVLSSDRYTLPIVSHVLLRMPVLLSALAYVTIIVQLTFVFLMWNRKLKLRLVAVMIGMHICIAAILGLVSFSLIMIAADLALLSDADWRFVRQRYTTIVRRLDERRRATVVRIRPERNARFDRNR